MINLFLSQTKNKYYIYYKMPSMNTNLLKQIIQSKYISNNIYSIEYIKEGETSNFYLTAPSYDKNYSLTKIENKEINLHNELYYYELIQEKPHIFPLKIKEKINLLSIVDQLHPKVLYIQILLLKIREKWRKNAISLYDDYLNGNNEPDYHFLIRKFQKGIIKFINTLTDNQYKNSPSEEIDQKILQDNFRLECRIATDNHFLIHELNKELDSLTFYNHISFQPIHYDKIIQSIQNYTFQQKYKNQIFSFDEITTIFNTDTQTIKISNQQVTTAQKDIVSLFPKYESKNDQHTDKTIIKQIQFAFKRTKITDEKIQIIDIFHGVTLTKVTIKIPSNVLYSKISKNLSNIQAAIGNENISMEIGTISDTINLLIPREKREILYFKQILDSKEFQEFQKEHELPMIAGEDIHGNYLFICLQKIKHLLIAGATGGGKSEFLNSLIISLLISVSTQRLKMILIDPKKVELSQYHGFPQVESIITNMNEATIRLELLVQEMENRYTLFSETKGVRNIQRYNEISTNQLPYIVCVIDEYADLIETNPEAEKLVIRLSQKSRAAGIHLIIATQKPLSTIVTSTLKSNLPSVVSFRMKSTNDYMTVFGKGIPYNLLGNGDGVAMLEGSNKEFIRFQSPLISHEESEREEILDQLKQILNNKNISLYHQEEQPIDKLKRYLSRTGETRLAKIREHLQIRMNDVGTLMNQLAQEGWLEKQGKGYVIIADENELNKWK